MPKKSTSDISTIDHKTSGNARFSAYYKNRGDIVGLGPTKGVAMADLYEKLLRKGIPIYQSARSAGRSHARVPTTRLIHVVQGNYGYGHGWEDLTAETTREEGKQRLREYRANETAPFRLIKRREKLPAAGRSHATVKSEISEALWNKVKVDRGWPETWDRHMDGNWYTVEKQKSGRWAWGYAHRRGDSDYGVDRGATWATRDAAMKNAEQHARVRSY